MMTAILLVILLLTHSLLSLIKKIQCYGFISLEYNHDNEKRINSRKGLSFKMKHNIKKEFLMLQLEDISTPKKLRQTIRK